MRKTIVIIAGATLVCSAGLGLAYCLSYRVREGVPTRRVSRFINSPPKGKSLSEIKQEIARMKNEKCFLTKEKFEGDIAWAYRRLMIEYQNSPYSIQNKFSSGLTNLNHNDLKMSYIIFEKFMKRISELRKIYKMDTEKPIPFGDPRINIPFEIPKQSVAPSVPSGELWEDFRARERAELERQVRDAAALLTRMKNLYQQLQEAKRLSRKRA